MSKGDHCREDVYLAANVIRPNLFDAELGVQGRVRNSNVAPVGEEALAMRADVPVEGEHADKRREFLWISDPESLGDLGFLVVPKCREHF